MKTSRSFPPVPESTRAARRFVLQAIGTVPPALADAIAVMVAELAMNAVQHARTGFKVTIDLAGATLRVEVTDSGAGRPAVQPMPPPDRLRGRGLPIVDGLADAWGVVASPAGSGKGIWFEIGMPSGTPERTAAAAARSVAGPGSTPMPAAAGQSSSTGSAGAAAPYPGGQARDRGRRWVPSSRLVAAGSRCCSW